MMLLKYLVVCLVATLVAFASRYLPTPWVQDLGLSMIIGGILIGLATIGAPRDVVTLSVAGIGLVAFGMLFRAIPLSEYPQPIPPEATSYVVWYVVLVLGVIFIERRNRRPDLGSRSKVEMVREEG